MYSLILNTLYFYFFLLPTVLKSNCFSVPRACMPSPLCYSFLLILFSCFLSSCTHLAVTSLMLLLPFWCFNGLSFGGFGLLPALSAFLLCYLSLDDFTCLSLTLCKLLINQSFQSWIIFLVNISLSFLYFFCNPITKENAIGVELSGGQALPGEFRGRLLWLLMKLLFTSGGTSLCQPQSPQQSKEVEKCLCLTWLIEFKLNCQRRWPVLMIQAADWDSKVMGHFLPFCWLLPGQ